MKHKSLILPLFIAIVSMIAEGCVLGGYNLARTQSQDSLSFCNDAFSMLLILQNESIVSMKIENRNNNGCIQEGAHIILVDGEIPEGTFREDHNITNDIVEYECGPAYEVYTNDYHIVFALEKDTLYRLDLLVYDSNNTCVPNGDYTLTIRK